MRRALGILLLVLLLPTLTVGCGTGGGAGAQAAAQETVVGTVLGVSLSARVIFLIDAVPDVKEVVLAEGARVTDAQGNPLSLSQIRRGQRIRAQGHMAEKTLVGQTFLATSVTVEGTSEASGWSGVRSQALRIGLPLPPAPRAEEREGVLYAYADRTAPGGARCYLYVEAYPRPAGACLPHPG